VVVLGSQIENHLLSTGAFEVYVNDQLVWSKLESGRLPSLPEFKDLLQQPSVTFSNVDPMSEAAA
jgi:selT/selW/selH-like putative selenoprotein